MDGSKQHNKKWAVGDRGAKKGPWKGAGDNHRFLIDWVRFPETKPAFPIGSSPRHMTGLHSWLERGQEERPSHLLIIMLPILCRMKRNYYLPKPIHQAILKHFLK